MSEQFETMTVVELREYAREHHIPLPAGINKQGIIDRLKEVSRQESVKESAEPAPEERAPASAPARQRTASIIADDSDYDYEDGDLAYRQPRVPQQTIYTQRPAATIQAKPADRPSAAPKPEKPDVLSTISSKAPAFNIDGVRAWHNPKSFQQSGSYNQGGYQQPSARQGWTKPAPAQAAERPSQGRPGYQAGSGIPEAPARTAEEAHAQFAGDSRYLKDYHTVQKTTLPELLAEGEFVDQQGVLSLQADGSGLMLDERQPRRILPVYITHTQVRRFALREGDLISGKTKAVRGSDGYRLMVYIERVNGEAAEDLKDRPDFLSLDVIVPKTPVQTDEGKKSAIRFGQRVLLVCGEDEDGLALLDRLAGSIQQANEDVHCILLSLGRSPEESQAFMDQASCPCLSVDSAADTDRQTKKVRGVLERAKRLAESGRKAVLLVDSLTALEELAEDAASPVRASVFFGTGRAFKNGGSVTVIGLIREKDAELPAITRLARFASATLQGDQV